MDARVRAGRASDREPLMRFIRRVWGGHDYLPGVWDQWLRDRKSRMFVVEVGGIPVGMNRLRFLEDDSAWIEGVRVHPDYRGRGLASMLGNEAMRAGTERGARMFRLTSGSRNWSAHRQITRMGFREVARFSVYSPPEKTDGAQGAGTAVVEGREAASLIRSTHEFTTGHGVFWHNWGAASLAPGVIGELAKEGAVRRLGGAVAIAGTGGEGPRPWREAGFVGGDPGDATRLVGHLIGGRGGGERWAFVPQGSPIIRALRASGYMRVFSNILFERRAAKS